MGNPDTLYVVIQSIREVVNQHSKSLKLIVEKVNKISELESKIEKLEQQLHAIKTLLENKKNSFYGDDGINDIFGDILGGKKK